MKIRINLYLPELHPVFQRLTLPRMLMLWLAFLAIAAGVSLGGRMLLWRQEARLPVLKQQIAQLDNHKRQLEETLAQRHPASFLEQELKNRTEEYQGKKLLLEHIDELGELENHGFSPWLHDLSQAHRPDIQLQAFTVENNQIRLEGVSTGNDAVPAWISSFRDYPQLRDRMFTALQMQRDKSGLLKFTLESRDVYRGNGTLAVDDSDSSSARTPAPQQQGAPAVAVQAKPAAQDRQNINLNTPVDAQKLTDLVSGAEAAAKSLPTGQRPASSADTEGAAP
jgi:Tfp pilus assembly protein PilN